MRRAFVAIIAWLGLVAGGARADETEEEAPAESQVVTLLRAGDLDGAYWAARANLASHPDDFAAELELAAAEVAYFHHADAEARLLRLEAEHPDAVEPLRLQAMLYFMTLRPDRGWAAVERGLARSPDDAELLATRDEQRALDRMRQPARAEDVAPVTRPVVALLESIRTGASDAEIAAPLVDRFGGLRDRRELIEFIRGARESATRPEGVRLSLSGYAIGEASRDAAGDHRVSATILVVSEFGTDLQEQMSDDVIAMSSVVGVGSIFAGLEPHEREVVARRLAGVRLETSFEVELVLTGDDEHARVKEVLVDGTSMTAVVSASRELVEKRAWKRLREKARDAWPFLAGGVITAIILLVEWLRKRRRARA